MVIFGATGDLTKRKLMPALFDLHRQDRLDPCFAIVGVGRTEMDSAAFAGAMREAVFEHSSDKVPATQWKAFARRLSYLQMDLGDPAAYSVLADLVGNRLFYLAVPPYAAPDVVTGLKRAGLTEEKPKTWSRIVVEKPFGTDLKSARVLNRLLCAAFDESQVFRIDHFLGKETVQNLLAFRFANTVFEPVWNRHYIDHVQITAAETLGLGHRARSYEQSGALRDMVTNHLLQMLTLTAMEPPYAFDASAVREEKTQILRSIQPMSGKDVERNTVRGQYGAGEVAGERVAGYRAEKGVTRGSTVETYAAIKLGIDNWRWAGVPFYLRTGKRLSRRITEIAVHFKRTPQALFRHVEGTVPRNAVVFQIQPDEGIRLTFSSKVPGEGMEMAHVRMAFDYGSAFGVDIPDAYETLLLDVMQGDATLFTRRDEVEAQWSLMTPILDAWSDDTGSTLARYAAGTDGPKAAADLLARDGRAWRPLDALFEQGKVAGTSR